MKEMTIYRCVMLFLLAVLILGCAKPPSRDMQLANQGFQYLSYGNYAEAEKYYDQAWAENRKNPYAILNLGVIYQNTNRPVLAREMYKKVIALNPKEVVAFSTAEGVAGNKTLVDLARENLKKLK